MIPNRTRSLALSILFAPSLALAVTVSVSTNPAHCGLANGAVFANVSGGLPPYSYSWSNGGGGTWIGGLIPGDYTVTVTDALSNTAQATGTVVNIPNLAEPSQNVVRSDCGGSCSGWTSIEENTMGGTAPFTYSWPFPDVSGGYATFMGTCAFQANPLQVTDANGCTGDFQLICWGGEPGYPDVEDTSPECGTQSNGSVTINYLVGGPATFKVTAPGGNPWGAGPIVDLFEAPYTISGLAAGDYEVWWWDTFGTPPMFQPGPVYCSLGAPFTIGTLSQPCGSVSGTVHHDADQDCIFNGADLKLPYKVMSIEPGGEYAITDANGYYSQNLAYGNYTIEQPLVNEVPLCPLTNPTAFTIDAGTPDAVVDMADSSTVPADVSVWIWHWDARPGFPTHASVVVSNWTAYPSGSVSVDLSYDPLLLNPSPASGHWDLGVLPPYSQQTMGFSAQVPANINLLGTVINYTAIITNSGADASAANNTASVDVTITGSYDPNDKQGTTSSALSPSQYFLAQDEWIDYTVRFQNTGTAAAETVTIRDTIDTDLDILSLEILAASHVFTPSFGQARELVFTFSDINLPDSTSDLLGSQGFIIYRIKPNDDVVVGTLLENTAGIYFDFNPPIITNTTSHVVDFSTATQQLVQGQLRLLPNPASDRISVVGVDGVIARIDIRSADGRLVKTAIPLGGSIDVHDLQPGAYHAIIHLRDGRTFTARFIRA